MNRRGFLGSILALGAAPAIVRADALMRIVPVDTVAITPFDFQFMGVWPASKTGDAARYVARFAGAGQEMVKNILISPTVIAAGFDVRSELSHQVLQRGREACRDIALQKYGTDWRLHMSRKEESRIVAAAFGVK